MCRSCSEGGRRCSDNWTPQERALHAKEAYTRRKINRAKRRLVADEAAAVFGADVRSEIMQLSPNHMTLVANRMDELSPGFADELSTAMGGAELPGTHNMVVQELRSESSAIDQDRLGNMKTDPMNVTKAMGALNAIDRAALEDGKVTGPEAEALADELEVREVAAAMGVTPNSPVDAQVARFYSNNDLSEVAALGNVTQRQEDRLRESIFSTVRADVSPRASLLEGDEKFMTPSELAATAPGEVNRRGLNIAENVVLKRDEDGALYYSVDRRYRLPASDLSTVENKLAKIPQVDDLRFDPTTAPPGQEALYERIAGDPDTQSALREGIIRAAFEDPRQGGMSVDVENFTFDEVTRPGKRSADSPAALVTTTSRKPGQFVAGSSVNPVANRHLERAAEIRSKSNKAYAEAWGVASEVHAAEETYKQRRTGSAGESLSTLRDAPLSAKARTSLAAIGEDGIPNTRRTERPEHGGYFARNRDFDDTDVDIAVGKANTFDPNGTPSDRIPTADLEASARVRLAYEEARVATAVNRKNGHERKPATNAAYTSIPADADINELFAPGAAFSNSEYVAAGVRVPRPRKEKGQRLVRTVYTSSNGAHVSPTRTIYGPGEAFRVASVNENKDGTVVVHLVDESDLAHA